jgi:hypothetical protein
MSRKMRLKRAYQQACDTPNFLPDFLSDHLQIARKPDRSPVVTPNPRAPAKDGVNKDE